VTSQPPRRTHRTQNGDGPPGQPGPATPPPQVVPSLEVLKAEFEGLVASNQAKFAELMARGTQPDPFYLVHSRINHLIDSISQFAGPNGPRWAMMTRLGFERLVAAELEEAGPVSVRMQLAEGGRYTPEMIRRLGQQTGTVRRAH
jgi:hypothetical protein